MDSMAEYHLDPVQVGVSPEEVRSSSLLRIDYLFKLPVMTMSVETLYAD